MKIWEPKTPVTVCVTPRLLRDCFTQHIVICGLPTLQYFSTLSHKWHDFRKELLNTKCVFWIPLKHFFWNISRSKKNGARYDQKYLVIFTQSTTYSCPILMTLNFLDSFFEKCSNIRFHENLSSGSRVVPYGRRTEGQTRRN